MTILLLTTSPLNLLKMIPSIRSSVASESIGADWRKIAIRVLICFAGLVCLAAHFAARTHAQGAPDLEFVEPSDGVLTNASDIFYFSEDNPDGTSPVDIFFKVNYWSSFLELVFVSDRFDSLFLSLSEEQFSSHPDYKPGTVLRIKGQFESDRYIIIPNEIEFVRDDDPVVPEEIHVDKINLGEKWSRRVRATGTLEEIHELPGLTHFGMRRGDRRFVLTIVGDVPDLSENWGSYIGREFSVVGALLYNTDSSGSPVAMEILLDDWDVLANQALEADEAQAISTISAATFFQAKSEPSGTSLWNVRGHLVEYGDEGGILVEDRTGGMWLDTIVGHNFRATNVVRHGSEFDLVVRCQEDGKFKPIFSKHFSFGNVPPIKRRRASEISIVDHHSRVGLSGWMNSYRAAGDRWILQVTSEGVPFEVHIRDRFEGDADFNWATARTIDAEGYVDFSNLSDGNSKFALHVSSMDKVQVRSHWWMLEPQLAITLLAIFAASTLAIVFWLARLSYKLKVSNDEKDSLRIRLVQSQKMDAIGRLVGGFAHDFNNLLVGIDGSLELLSLKEPLSDDVRRRLLVDARDCSRRASELVRSLLSFSSRNELRLTTTNLNHSVEHAVSIARTLVGPSVQFDMSLSENLIPFHHDGLQIEQVLINLFLNARDAFGTDPGTITVSTFNELTVDSAQVAVIKVQDNGQGMDSETVDRIFEPFFTTKPKGQGTGLGMSMAYAIINKHGGQIRVHSVPGRGSQFHLIFDPFTDLSQKQSEHRDTELLARMPNSRRLSVDEPDFFPEETHTHLEFLGSPSSEATTNPAEYVTTERVDPEHYRPKSLRRDRRVLLTDDDPAVRRVGEAMLKTLGYNVVTANDGMEALKLCCSDASVTCVVMDLIMPNMSGSETFVQLRKLRPELPVIICSGFVEDPEQWEDLKCEPRPLFLSKPFRMTDLEELLERVHRERDDSEVGNP